MKVAVVGDAGSGKTTLCQKAQELLNGADYNYVFEWHDVNDLSELEVVNPDVVLNAVSAIDIERSLLLTTRLIDRHLKLVMALNHYDQLLATDHTLDYRRLGWLMGFRVIPTDAVTGTGIFETLDCIVAAHEGKEDATKHVHVTYGTDIEEAIQVITRELVKVAKIKGRYSKRYIAIQLLEDPKKAMHIFEHESNYYDILEVVERQRHLLFKEFKEYPEQLIQKAKNGFVAGALNDTLRHSKSDTDHTLTQKIDAVLTNRWLGFPILIVALYIMFQCTFVLGTYPQEWIASGVDVLCQWLKGLLPAGWLTSMLVDGVVQGVGAVVSFLPNIVIMFFFISLMEDSGYMARAAFLMDEIMHRVGLHGKSFIPMLIGFGCNVPAIMAARSIEDKKDRTLTMLMIPFMSCSARLPVYMLFVSAFFDVRYRALIMMSLYLVGILLSIGFALIMKRTKYFRKKQDDFVSELPPFRKPTWRNTGTHIWERVADYLHKIATVILWASMVIWALEYFPRNKELVEPIEQQMALVEHDASLTESQRAYELKSLERECVYIQSENSYLAKIGKAIAPVMKPLGFDWRLNVCILTGLPAKEAIVSTMGILYRVTPDSDSPEVETNLVSTLQATSNFNPVTAYAFMLFVLLYFPCIATIATLRREIGNGWAAFTVVHSLCLAWVVAFLVYQLGSIL